MSPQLPTCLALVLSDSIHVCPSTQKRTILGTFTSVFASTFPTSINVAVYCCLTDAIGKVLLEIRFVKVKSDELEDELIASAHGELDFTDPRVMIELNMMFRQLPLQSPGEYRFQACVDDTILLERRLVVIPVTDEADLDDEDTTQDDSTPPLPR